MKRDDVSLARDQTHPTTAWDDATLRRPHAQPDKAARVRSMFDAIAPTYERVNRVASFGRDAAWRRRAVAAAAVRPADVLLDVACGTGDMIRAFDAAPMPPERLIGADFSGGMLSRGHYEGLRRPLQLLQADAQRLPLADASVDIVSCAFGVRNFQDLAAGLAEMQRVLRPGGRVVILEFALPESPLLRVPYRLYTEFILPRLGRWLSRDRSGAYRYLPQSVRSFARRRELAALLETAGFAEVTATPMNLGGVVLYRAVKRAG